MHMQITPWDLQGPFVQENIQYYSFQADMTDDSFLCFGGWRWHILPILGFGGYCLSLLPTTMPGTLSLSLLPRPAFINHRQGTFIHIPYNMVFLSWRSNGNSGFQVLYIRLPAERGGAPHLWYCQREGKETRLGQYEDVKVTKCSNSEC